MEAGKLRHRITIQQQATTQDSSGQLNETWTTFATVWASVEPLRGREFFMSQQEQAAITTKIRIRYLSGVLPKMRISFNSMIYDIRSVINIDERNKEMLLMCDEAVS